MSMTQGSLVANSAQLHVYVEELVAIVGDAVEQHTPIHEVERKALKTLLDMGHATLQMLLEQLGSGDVGEVVELDDGKKLKRSEQTHTREYMSIFGTLQLRRHVYAKRQGAKMELVPLDARLGLPESKFSYLLPRSSHTAAKVAPNREQNAWQRLARSTRSTPILALQNKSWTHCFVRPRNATATATRKRNLARIHNTNAFAPCSITPTLTEMRSREQPRFSVGWQKKSPRELRSMKRELPPSRSCRSWMVNTPCGTHATCFSPRF